MNIGETMKSIRMVVRTVLICIMFIALECWACAGTPSISSLLDKYTQALDSTQSFVSSWNSSEKWSQSVPSLGLRANNTKVFREGEYRTDNKGRSYERSYRWGQIGGSFASREQAHYLMWIIGEGFMYRHDRPLGQTKYRGYLNYRKKGTPGWDTPDRKTWGYFDGTLTNSLFLGYIGTRARLDGILRNARRISMRPKPEMIRGSRCYVIHAQTKYGDFRVWLDSGHGFHPARIQALVGIGDDIGNPGSPHIITRKEGITREYTLDNVRFEKVDGVWTPMEADRNGHIVLGSENGFSDIKVHFKRKKILLNPDHDELGSFADPMHNPGLDPEIRNGTEVNLNLGDGVKYTWLNGKPVEEAEDRKPEENKR